MSYLLQYKVDPALSKQLSQEAQAKGCQVLKLFPNICGSTFMHKKFLPACFILVPLSLWMLLCLEELMLHLLEPSHSWYPTSDALVHLHKISFFTFLILRWEQSQRRLLLLQKSSWRIWGPRWQIFAWNDQELLLQITHCGGVGTGGAVKICNNLLLAISMIGTSEAMNLGIK